MVSLCIFVDILNISEMCILSSGDGRVDTIITDERAQELALHKVDTGLSRL